MFFDLDLALAALPELGPRTRDGAVERLLPGAGHRCCCPTRRGATRSRAARMPERLGRARARRSTGALAPLAAARWPVLQSSANPTGGADARRLDDVDPRDPRGASTCSSTAASCPARRRRWST